MQKVSYVISRRRRLELTQRTSKYDVVKRHQSQRIKWRTMRFILGLPYNVDQLRGAWHSRAVSPLELWDKKLEIKEKEAPKKQPQQRELPNLEELREIIKKPQTTPAKVEVAASETKTVQDQKQTEPKPEEKTDQPPQESLTETKVQPTPETSLEQTLAALHAQKSELLLTQPKQEPKILPTPTLVEQVAPAPKEDRLVQAQYYTNVMSEYFHQNDFESLLNYFTKLEKMGLVTTEAYNLVINATLKPENEEKSLEFRLLNALPYLDRMIENKIMPNSLTFLPFVQNFCQAHFFEEALQMISLMTQFNVSPTSAFFLPIVQCLVQRRKYLDARCIILSMAKDFKLAIDLNIVTIYMKALFKEGYVRPSMEIETFNALVTEFDVIPDGFLYTNIIEVLCKDHNVEAAFGLLEQMKRSGIPPTIWTYNHILGGIAIAGKVDKALEFFEELKAQFKPDEVTLGYIIRALNFPGKNRESEIFPLFLSIVRDYQLDVGHPTYALMLRAFISSRRFDDVAKLLSFMEKNNFSMDPYLLTSMMKSYFDFHEKERGLQVFNTIRKNFSVDKTVYHTVVAGCLEADDIENALKFYGEMVQLKLEPRVQDLIRLMDFLIKAERIPEAKKIVDDMKNLGIKLILPKKLEVVLK
jgi:pentatricopeptide repeat protein